VRWFIFNDLYAILTTENCVVLQARGMALVAHQIYRSNRPL